MTDFFITMCIFYVNKNVFIEKQGKDNEAILTARKEENMSKKHTSLTE